MKILLCYMYSEGHSNADYMIPAFEYLGHDIKTCGPTQGNFDGQELKKGHDISVFDQRSHPETYTYDNILGLYKLRYGYYPDLVVQTDPHFYFVGNKPKNITSVYWIMDAHRGASVFRRMAIEGNFDKVFVAQKYYMPIFKNAGIDCEYLTWGYDDFNIYEHKSLAVECDISFAGTLGFTRELYEFLFGRESSKPFQRYDNEIDLVYVNLAEINSYLRIDKIINSKYFIGWDNRSMEYAERTELLARLSKDFDVRVYEKCFDTEKYAKILCRGKIGFYHSLKRDVALKLFEIPGVDRLLITDEIPYLDELMTDKKHLVTYRSYFQPQFANFDLDYEEVKGKVDYYLTHKEKREEISQSGFENVKSKHTFKARMQEMLQRI